MAPLLSTSLTMAAAAAAAAVVAKIVVNKTLMMMMMTTMTIMALLCSLALPRVASAGPVAAQDRGLSWRKPGPSSSSSSSPLLLLASAPPAELQLSQCPKLPTPLQGKIIRLLPFYLSVSFFSFFFLFFFLFFLVSFLISRFWFEEGQGIFIFIFWKKKMARN
jgi:hypothetical protein